MPDPKVTWPGLIEVSASSSRSGSETFSGPVCQVADAKRHVLANLEWHTVQEEDKQNQELLELSQQILELTKAVHAYAQARSDGT